jgi:hypothetical protein
MCFKTQIERYMMKIILYPLKMLCTRSNVSYVFSIMSKRKSNPCKSNWKIVNNNLKYLKITKMFF